MQELNTELQASLATTVAKYNSHRKMLKHAYKELVAHEDGKGEIHIYPPRSQQLIEHIAQVLMHQPLSSSSANNEKDSINDGLISISSRSSQSAFLSNDTLHSSSVLPATTSTSFGLPSTKEPQLHSHKHRSKDASRRTNKINSNNSEGAIHKKINSNSLPQHDHKSTFENEQEEKHKSNKSNRSNNNTYDRGNEFSGENDNAFGGDVGCAFPPSVAAVSCENNTKLNENKEESNKKSQKEKHKSNKSNRSNNNTYDRGNEFSGENDNAFGGDVGCAFPPSVAAVSCENNTKINEPDNNDTNRYIIDSNDVESYNQELSQYTSREALTNNTLSNHYSSASTHPTQREMTINKDARPEIDHTEWHADDFHANVNDDDDDDDEDDDNNDGLISSTDPTSLTQNRYHNNNKNFNNNNVVNLLSNQSNLSTEPENKNNSLISKDKLYISTNTQSSRINDNSDNFVSALSAPNNISNNKSNTVAGSSNVKPSSQQTSNNDKYKEQNVKQDDNNNNNYLKNSSLQSAQKYTHENVQEQSQSSRKTSFSSMTNSRYAPLNLSNTYHESNTDGNNNNNNDIHSNNEENTTPSSVRRHSFEKLHKTLRGPSHRENLEGLAYDFKSCSSLASNDSKYYSNNKYATCSGNVNTRQGSSSNYYEHGPNRKASMSSLTSELSSTRFDNNENRNSDNNNNGEDDEINSQLKSSVAQAAIRVRHSLEAKLTEESELNDPNANSEAKCNTCEIQTSNVNVSANREKHDAAVNVSKSTLHPTSRKKRPVGIPITPWPIPENNNKNNNNKGNECKELHPVSHESLAEQLQRQGIVPSSAISRTHSHSCSNSRHEPQVHCVCEKDNDTDTNDNNNKNSDKLYKVNEGALITEPQPQAEQIIVRPVTSDVSCAKIKKDSITQKCVVSEQQQPVTTNTETPNKACKNEEEKLRSENEIRRAAARYREKELQDMARVSSVKAQSSTIPEQESKECIETNAFASNDLHEEQRKAEVEFDHQHKRNVEQNTIPALRTAVSRRNGGHFLDSSQIEKAMYGAKVNRTPWSREVVSDVAAVREYMEKEDAKLAHRKAKEKLDNAIALTAAEEAAIVRARSPSRALVPLSGLNLSPTSQYGNNVSVGMIMSSNRINSVNGDGGTATTSYSRERNYEGALVIRDEDGKLVAVDDNNKEEQCNVLRNFPNEVKIIPTTTERQLLAERAILEQQLDRMVREVELISSKNNENGHEPRYAQLNARITRVQADLTKVNKELSTVIHLERKARQGL